MRSTWPSSILRQQYLHQVNIISHSGHGSLSPLQAEGVKSVSLLVLGLQQPQVRLPLVADDFAAGEASDGNDHGGIMTLSEMLHHDGTGQRYQEISLHMRKVDWITYYIYIIYQMLILSLRVSSHPPVVPLLAVVLLLLLLVLLSHLLLVAHLPVVAVVAHPDPLGRRLTTVIVSRP